MRFDELDEPDELVEPAELDEFFDDFVEFEPDFVEFEPDEPDVESFDDAEPPFKISFSSLSFLFSVSS